MAKPTRLIPFRLNNSALSKAVILLGLTRLRGVAPGRSDLRIAIPIHAICQLCTVILERAIIPGGIIPPAGNTFVPQTVSLRATI